MRVEPELARGGIRLRQFGQEIIEVLGGKKIHPAWAVPGGVRNALTAEARDHIRQRVPEALATVQGGLDRFKGVLDRYREEAETFGNFPTLFMGMVDCRRLLGTLRRRYPLRRLRRARSSPTTCAQPTTRISSARRSSRSSFLKSPYYRPMGYPDGMYRVGPLARLNVCERMGSPLAERGVPGIPRSLRRRGQSLRSCSTTPD